MNNAELDRFLAENVMGWCNYNDSERWLDEGGYETGYLINDKPFYGSIWWHPTTSIEQAMMCAEKLEEVEEIEISFPRVDEGYYIARMFAKHKLYEGKAKTKELAICHAIYESRANDGR